MGFDKNAKSGHSVLKAMRKSLKESKARNVKAAVADDKEEVIWSDQIL